MVVPVQFDETQFSPTIIRKKNPSKKKVPAHGYDSDVENNFDIYQILEDVETLKRFYDQLPKSLENQNKLE